VDGGSVSRSRLTSQALLGVADESRGPKDGCLLKISGIPTEEIHPVDSVILAWPRQLFEQQLRRTLRRPRPPFGSADGPLTALLLVVSVLLTELDIPLCRPNGSSPQHQPVLLAVVARWSGCSTACSLQCGRSLVTGAASVCCWAAIRSHAWPGVKVVQQMRLTWCLGCSISAGLALDGP